MKRIVHLFVFVVAVLCVLTANSGWAKAASFVVDSATDTADVAAGDGVCQTAETVCTLRAAIQEVNALAGTESADITFDAAVTTVELTSDLPTINYPLSIMGTTGVTTIVGGDSYSLTINTGVVVSLSSLILSDWFLFTNDGNLTAVDVQFNSFASTANTVLNKFSTILNFNRCVIQNGAGVGLLNYGAVTLANSTITGMSKRAITNVNVSSSLTMTGSTLSHNAMATNTGGGIYNGAGAQLVVRNSTIASNTARNGGGVANYGAASIYFSTMTNNAATSSASPAGGGYYQASAGTLTLYGSIVADNYKGSVLDDCSDAGSSVINYSLNSSATCSFETKGLHNSDGAAAGLLTLADHGGDAETILINTESIALNVVPSDACVDETGAVLATDQRGFLRPVDSLCDLGSVEIRDADADGEYEVTDCNDNNVSVNSAATEICDAVDNDCDTLVDDDDTISGGILRYQDNDGDNYGQTGVSQHFCIVPAGWAEANGDCNDSDASIHPGAAEACNGIDDNCSSTADEGLLECDTSHDDDGDGYTVTAGDCNDSNSEVHPGAAETCNGIDDDCDASVDELAVDASVFYQDADNDSYGSFAVSVSACAMPEGYVSTTGDCDDTKALVNAGAVEICDTLDNNCDGQVDEDVSTTFYADEDGDTYGDPANSTAACTAPADYVSNSNDCNDASPLAYTGATEIPDDGVDNDCVDGDAITPVELSVCGNSIIESGEVCDDGNLIDGDGCSSICASESPTPADPTDPAIPADPTTSVECGNSVIETGETCDDGNVIADDGCDDTCQIEEDSSSSTGASSGGCSLNGAAQVGSVNVVWVLLVGLSVANNIIRKNKYEK